jgi:hypothetical protein
MRVAPLAAPAFDQPGHFVLLSAHISGVDAWRLGLFSDLPQNLIV